MKMMYFVLCILLAGLSVTVTSCATNNDSEVHHDQAVRKMADEDFESRIGY